jgi:putative protease
VTAEEDREDMARLAAAFSLLRPDGVLASSLASWPLLAATGLPVWVDYSLNAFNRLALDFWRSLGAEGVTLSQELTLRQAAELAAARILPVECLVAGRAELMITEYSVTETFARELKKSAAQGGERPEYFLRDRLNETFPLATDQFGRMHVLNAKELSLAAHLPEAAAAGIARLRIDGRYFSAARLARAVADCRRSLTGARADNPPDSTRGHYFRGVV